MAERVIVVGGGLSGLSAAHIVLEHGGRVLLLDKKPILGGNSSRATSGINAALTRTQLTQGVSDSVDLFYEDTLKGARDRVQPELVKVLTGQSAPAVTWLQDRFGLDLSLVSRLGGHSQPRTHRGKERFPGMTITYGLLEALEEISQKSPELATIVTRARVVALLKEGEGVAGVAYELADGSRHEARGPVVVATGGFSADFGPDSLLNKYRPDLVALNLSTTNGDHTTGDGIKLGLAAGADVVDMDMVQVHPTGLVDPKDPHNKVKFLAAEALRGVGGILLDGRGSRFCNELGHRDFVTGEMRKVAGPVRLVLNSAAAKEIEWHCHHYAGKGLMRTYSSGADLAADIGISPDALKATFDAYNRAAAANSDPLGRLYFTNGSFQMADTFHVALMEPVLHYSMGGLRINAQSSCLYPDGRVVPGLFACGEVAGGVHGVNRLGGSSLLDCVVFGRVAGVSAARLLYSQLLQQDAAGGAGVSGYSLKVFPNEHRVQVSLDYSASSAGSSEQQLAPSATLAATGPVAPGPVETQAPSRTRAWTLEEVQKHNTKDDCWVIVNGQVLDVTSFLSDHPGGAQAIIAYAGRDATEQFNMLHKADVIDKYAPNCVIGVLEAGPQPSSSQALPEFAAGLAPSDTQSRNSGGTAHILPAERAQGSFDVQKMINFIDGGEEKTKRRRWILSTLLGKDSTAKHFYSSSAEKLKSHVKHFIEVHQPWWDSFVPTREEVGWMTDVSTQAGSMNNHYGLFLPTIASQATDEQKGWWLWAAITCQIIGCYAQTELGHGSNVRGLATTATYDQATQEFIIDTPTLQSMKWWPGTLGKLATHAIVYAQLLLPNERGVLEEKGVHSFMMQIRDENHHPLPGIEVGDLGPKQGDNANDTGYMRLTQVRVPREYLLSRFQEVTPDGRYIISEAKEKNPQLHYFTMMSTRGSMVKSSGGYLAKAVVIAARYSCVRRQGFVNTERGVSYQSAERPIIDWEIQRYRIMTQLALTYAIKFSGSWLIHQFAGIDDLAQVEGLAEIASTTAGLKALCTYLAAQGIEDCRKCCGGNGYLLSSGVAGLESDFKWQITAEGDWVILILQTARFLLKSFQDAAAGAPVPGPVAYLSPLSGGQAAINKAHPFAGRELAAKDFSCLDSLQALMYHRALIAVSAAGYEMQSRLQAGELLDDARNHTALAFFNAVRAHTYAFMLEHFAGAVRSAEAFDPACAAALRRLCVLFAVANIIDDQWAGVLTHEQVQMARICASKTMAEIRPDIIPLTDAFDLPDHVLLSAIGRHDGNVYEALYTSATRCPLNKDQVFDGYQEYLQPHLDLEGLLQVKNQRSKL